MLSFLPEQGEQLYVEELAVLAEVSPQLALLLETALFQHPHRRPVMR